MKAELRSQRASGAAESGTGDGREKAQESQNKLSLFEPFVPFRGDSVNVNASRQSGRWSNQIMINLVKYKSFGQDDSQFPYKYFSVNDLQNKRLVGGSNPIKVNQSGLVSLSSRSFLILNS
jgi:hypothetical protein